VPADTDTSEFDSTRRAKWTGKVEGGKIGRPSEAELREIL